MTEYLTNLMIYILMVLLLFWQKQDSNAAELNGATGYSSFANAGSAAAAGGEAASDIDGTGLSRSGARIVGGAMAGVVEPPLLYSSKAPLGGFLGALHEANLGTNSPRSGGSPSSSSPSTSRPHPSSVVPEASGAAAAAARERTASSQLHDALVIGVEAKLRAHLGEFLFRFLNIPEYSTNIILFIMILYFCERCHRAASFPARL